MGFKRFWIFNRWKLSALNRKKEDLPKDVLTQRWFAKALVVVAQEKTEQPRKIEVIRTNEVLLRDWGFTKPTPSYLRL